ncbi:MAG: VOC family protein [Chitinophagaceae bacterium]|nr:MAG: VOC family protein [Chitinophagaceae bacterium]
MDAIKFPQGYNQVMPYLILENANAFQTFMETVFHAEEKMKVLRDDKTIMHAELRLGDVVIMFAQSSNEFPPTPGAFFIYVNDADATFNDALANGATKLQDVTDQDYGRSGGVKDSNGNTWWITAEKK